MPDADIRPLARSLLVSLGYAVHVLTEGELQAAIQVGMFHAENGHGPPPARTGNDPRASLEDAIAALALAVEFTGETDS